MFPYLQYLLYSKIIFIAIDIKYLSKLGGYHVIYIFHSIIIIVYKPKQSILFTIAPTKGRRHKKSECYADKSICLHPSGVERKDEKKFELRFCFV